MEKLNEVKEEFYPQYGTPGSRDMEVTARRKVIDENIEAVAEAFRALEQRAEAAEAKLAELAKQEPVGKQYRVSAKGNEAATGWSIWMAGDGEQYAKMEHYNVQVREVFTHPAPAADLAELVPGIMETPTATITYSRGLADGWNDCRTLILRNIEEAK